MSGFSWTIPPTGGAGVSGGDDALDRELGRLLGTDVLFDNDTVVGTDGDYVLLSGLNNLRAAIYRRLLTRPGEYKFVPDYGVGVPSYVKRRANSTTVDQLRIAITEQLLRETRIEEVVDVAIEVSGDSVNIGLVIRAAGRALRFRPFTFSEEQ